jgi:DNA polymerase-1
MQLLPLTLLSVDGLEADDKIAYLAEKYSKIEECKQVTIMSADQDFLQLTNNKIQVYSPTNKKTYGLVDVIKEYSIHPNNFLIMKMLMGDSSDNLPGINGLGPKKLEKLFPELKKEKVFTLN